MSELYNLLPIDLNIPWIYGRSNVKSKWNNSDSEELFKAGKSNPAFGENDICYSFNSHGYRCPDFNTIANFRIISIGCSYVEGIGLADPCIFHEIIASKLREETRASWVNWNLAKAAASNEYSLRVLMFAVPWLKPDLVVINFTYASRREYLTDRGECLRHFVGANHRALAASVLPIDRALFGLISSNDDALNLFRCYSGIARLLSATNWFFGCASKELEDYLVGYADMRRYVGVIDRVDKARDNSHPGIESHKLFAEKFWKRLQGSEFFRGWCSRPAA